MEQRDLGRPVLVTTQNRGVFFGYFDSRNNARVKLLRARNCIYWPRENRGFLGLAADGPLAGARVGPAADIELDGVTCIADVTEKAVVRWESGPWN